ncbi:DUF935 family protein [Klebsiella michiganensis]|nr:DUF935 family protein [Klebsiella michiganensis]
MMDWCERTESKVILGATLTSQADGKTSTNALGNVHNDVRHDILVSDAKQLHGFFSNMIDMLLRINGYEVSRRKLPKLVFDTRDIEDIETFSAGVKNLVESGVKTIPASWVHTKLGIPVPQKDEAVLEAPAQTGTPLPVALSQRFRRIAALTTAAELSDPAQEALDNGYVRCRRRSPPPCRTSLRRWSLPCRMYRLPDEAMDIIAGSYPDLDDSELVTLLEQALFVADVWGRLNSDA